MCLKQKHKIYLIKLTSQFGEAFFFSTYFLCDKSKTHTQFVSLGV